MKKDDGKYLVIGIVVIVVALIAGIVMFIKGGDKDDKAGSIDEETGKMNFVVGFDASFPPYGYLEDGEYVGFDLDLAAEVCERLGWELKKQPIDWASKDLELNGDNISCIWNGFTMSDDRLDQYTWSDPYVDNSQVVIVKADSGIEKLADLAGKKVGVQAASSALEALNGEDQADLKESLDELLQVADYETAFLELKAGNVDAVAMDIGVAKTKIASYGEDYVILDEIIAKEQYAIGFKLGNTELRDEVQDTLDEMVKDGTFAEIAKKWGLEDSVCLGK
ncbi:MAG: amino acid ABC transporter substrate-binding protein [Lachnospiraceae bacterium]|nr:amino acid ABC transporter substrate-binding protein [Lachnospiraceae bacterium]